MNRQKKLKIGIGLLIPICIFTFIILNQINQTSSDEFSLAKYVIVSIDGMNQDATATATLDDIGLYNYLAGKDASEAEKSKYTDFIDSIEYTLDDTEGLSNGDTIQVTVSYDSDLAELANIDVDITSRNVSVSGLKKGTELDAFEDLKIITSGISPYMSVVYVNESENAYLSTIEYSLSKASGLAIGDTITITCLADKNNAAEEGYFFTTKEMTYTIQEADKYISDINEVPLEIITDLAITDIQTIVDETEDTTFHMSFSVTNSNKYLYRDNNESAVGFEQIQAQLAYNDTGYEQEYENYILVFYKGSIALPTYSEENPYEYIDAYFCFLYTDAVITMDGEISMAVNDPEFRYVCGETYDKALFYAQEEIGTNYEYQNIFSND